MAKKIKEFPK